MAMVVPASKHTLFFRGLSSSVSMEKVRNLMVKEGGPCSIVFHKIDEMGGRLFIALRFDSSKVAEEIKERYDGHDLFGHKVQVSWFKDMRKARMLAAQRGYPQPGPYPAAFRPGFQQYPPYQQPYRPNAGFIPRAPFQHQFPYPQPGYAQGGRYHGDRGGGGGSHSRSRSRSSGESSRSGSRSTFDSSPRDRKHRSKKRRRHSSEASYSHSSKSSGSSDRSRSSSRSKSRDKGAVGEDEKPSFKSTFKDGTEDDSKEKKRKKRKKVVHEEPADDIEDPLAQSMIGLSEDSINTVQEKKDEIEQFYRQDCETFATVVKMLVSKDASLEDKIQDSLRQNLQEIGQRCLQELQQVISELRAKEGLDNPGS